MTEIAAPEPLATTHRRLDFAASFKEAALAAAVAVALAVPLIGFRVVESNGTVGLTTRFSWVAIGVAAVFFGRLVLALSRVARQRPGVSRGGAQLAPLLRFGRRYARLIGMFGVGLAIVLPAFATRSVVDLATTVVIYVMLGWGLNVVVGLAGLLDLGYVAFYAVGAYSFALIAHALALSFWEALPIAGLCAATAGILLGFPVLRLRGDYLAIVTLGFGEIIHILLLNWTSLTGGPSGFGDIPRPSLFGLVFAPHAPAGYRTFQEFFGVDFSPAQRIDFLYYIVLAMALLTNLFTIRLRHLPIGRAWEALREDEIACRALGINPTTVKLSAFAIGAMLGGFAGAFFATRQGFISPESFTFIESATILAIVVLGGMGSQLGVVLAAIVLVMAPEVGRAFSEFRMLIFGAAMVGIMVWQPRGLLSYRAPSLRLRPRGEAAP
jgi:branched-chain amino acid transport system permease protein